MTAAEKEAGVFLSPRPTFDRIRDATGVAPAQGAGSGRERDFVSPSSEERMNLLTLIYTAGGTLLILLAIPLIIRRVPPNPVYGFRVQWTRNDPELWYSVNAYTGKWLALVGASSILGAIGFLYIPGISVAGYAFACLGLFLVVFVLGLLQSARYLRSQDNQK
jgi:hypothetical protein